MNVYIAGLVIFLTSLLVFCVSGSLTRRPPRISLDRLADPTPLPGELARAGLFDVQWQDPTFAGASQTGQPPDTGPLLIMSEHAAGLAALEREVRAMVRAAEEQIPERWR